MVLQVEHASPLQGALKMARKTQHWSDEEDGPNQKSPEEFASHHEPQSESTFCFHAPQQMYIPVLSSGSFMVFPHSYAICTAVLPREGFTADTFTPPQELSLGDNYSASDEPVSAIASADEQPFIPVVTESRHSEKEQFGYGWKFLTLRKRSNVGQQSPALPCQTLTWTLDFPAELCGRLIGKRGRNKRKLMHKTKTHITICKDEQNEAKQILTICGAESQIFEAISFIEELFAGKEGSPGFMSCRTLPMVYHTNSTNIVKQIELPAGMEVNVVISSVFNAGHFYLVIPRFVAVSFKDNLENQINKFYDSGHTPKLSSTSTLVGTYCVGNLHNKWYRVQVIEKFVKSGKVEVLLVDYGQFAILPLSSLRRMRVDFLDVPFQAIECCLANIVPRGGDYFFSLSGTDMFQRLTENMKLKAICRGVQAGISMVDLYSVDNKKLTWINKRLVELGVANWGEVAF